EPIHLHHGEGVVDVGRGTVADIDPSAPGSEYWAFDGIHRIDTGKLITPERPWPNFRIWWDGDALAGILNDGKVEEWNPERKSLARLLTVGASGVRGVSRPSPSRGAPQFYGDILGD